MVQLLPGRSLNGILYRRAVLSMAQPGILTLLRYAWQAYSFLAMFTTKAVKLVRKIGHTGARSNVLVAVEGRVL
jgi:hypothetical protein